MVVPVTGEERVPSERIPVERIEVAGGPANLTPLQRAGMWLALGVGGLIAVALAFFGLLWMTSVPGPPAIPSNATAEVRSALLADYVALNEVAVERITGMFGLVITTTLLPVFTAILGYIFGTRNDEA